MSLERVNVKLFVREGALPAPDAFVPVFHRWISERALPEVLVDVHDYSHVPDGAGILLVGLEANVSIDETGGEPGLLYGRKRPLEGDDAARLRHALARAVDVASKLVAEPTLGGKLAFRTDRLRVIVNDRLASPNHDATLERTRPTLGQVLGTLWDGAPLRLARDADPRQRFTVDVTGPADPGLDVWSARLKA